MAIRVLHVVGGMNRGGAETWLMHVLRNIDRERFRMDFLVHTTQPCAYDDEIRALGSQIIPCLHPRRPLTYARNLKRALREHGPYDVIHSHVHHYSGWVLRAARGAGAPVRIAHSHNDTSRVQAQASFPRRLYFALTRRWIAQHATQGLACSSQAAAALFGPTWEGDPRWRVLYCGIDLAPFREPVDRAAVRAGLGIPADAFVVGHVGRFAEQKNHAFLVEIAREIVARAPQARLLLVGDGPLRPTIVQRVEQAGLAGHVIFAGVRPDVPRLMLGAMDVFLMPSLYEGLPVVSLEAQAAGLPAVLSDTVTSELSVLPDLVTWLPLSQPATAWAETILALRGKTEEVSQSYAMAVIENSEFGIRFGVKRLESIYGGQR